MRPAVLEGRSQLEQHCLDVLYRLDRLGIRIASLHLTPDKQLSLGHSHRLASQESPVLRYPHLDPTAPGRCLERHELRLAQPLPPEVGQAAMGQASYRVFVNTSSRGEEEADIASSLYFFARFQTWRRWPLPGLEENSFGRSLPGGAKQNFCVSSSSS